MPGSRKNILNKAKTERLQKRIKVSFFVFSGAWRTEEHD